MHPAKDFIFGLFNISVLIGLVIWKGRKLARHFFYARRSGISRSIITAAKELRIARLRKKNSLNNMNNLENDIVQTQKDINERTGIECDKIIRGADLRSKHIIEMAIRACDEEHKKALSEVRRSIITQAFKRAKTKIAGKMTDNESKIATQSGLNGLFNSLENIK